MSMLRAVRENDIMTQLPADEVAEQQQLLQAYRRTLAIYLRQAAELGGMAYSPPALLNGLDEARRNIARIKGILRGAGVDVADDPDDEVVDDWATARPERSIAATMDARPPTRRPRRRMVLAGAGVAAVAVVAVLMRWVAGPSLDLPLRATPPPTTQNFTVKGAAMEPTFAVGEVVRIEPVDPTALRRGDVVLIAPFDADPYLKRIIGLPGDTLGIRDGRVYVNGELLNEPYVHGAPTTCRVDDMCTSIKVLNGTVYVLGDNRANSADSREYGPVPISQIKGRALAPSP
jgi:signal peptidase I